MAVNWFMVAHFNPERWDCHCGETVAPGMCAFIKSSMWFFYFWFFFLGIKSLWEQESVYSFTYSEEGKVPEADQSYGATECTVKGLHYNLTVIYREKILHVLLSLIYADLFQQVFLFVCLFILSVQINIHAGLKGQEVTCILLPSITDLMAQVCQGVTCCSVDGGSWWWSLPFLGNLDAAFFRAHPPFFFLQLLNRLTSFNKAKF